MGKARERKIECDKNFSCDRFQRVSSISISFFVYIVRSLFSGKNSVFGQIRCVSSSYLLRRIFKLVFSSPHTECPVTRVNNIFYMNHFIKFDKKNRKKIEKKNLTVIVFDVGRFS